jgi:hypothetical protein
VDPYPITTILDYRVPLPGGCRERDDVPAHIYDQVRALLAERNTCTDARVDEIDKIILSLLGKLCTGH